MVVTATVEPRAATQTTPCCAPAAPTTRATPSVRSTMWPCPRVWNRSMPLWTAMPASSGLPQPAALGPRQPEQRLQQRRQVHGAVHRLEGGVLDLLRRLSLDVQPVEALLGALRARLVVEAGDQPARQGALGVTRSEVGGGRLAAEQAVVGLEGLVGHPQGLAVDL